MSNPETLMTIADAAAYLGMGKSGLYRLKRDGKLHGFIRSHAGRTMLEIQGLAQHVAAVMRPDRRRAGHLQTNAPRPQGSEVLDLLNERARHEKAKADLAELDLARRHQRLAEVAEVRQHLARHLRQARDQFQLLGAKIAPQIVGLDNDHAVRVVIDQAVHEILESLARNPFPADWENNERRDDASADDAAAP